MRIMNYEETNDQLSYVLNTALLEDVIVKNKDGHNFKVLSVSSSNSKNRSPFENVKCIKANINADQIVAAIRESRAGT